MPLANCSAPFRKLGEDEFRRQHPIMRAQRGGEKRKEREEKRREGGGGKKASAITRTLSSTPGGLGLESEMGFARAASPLPHCCCDCLIIFVS